MRRSWHAFAFGFICCVWMPLAHAHDLRAGGTGSATELLRVLLAAFGKQADVEGRVVPNFGTTGALHALADGVLDVAVAGRAPNPEEAAKGLVVAYTARTPFVIATSHPKPNALSLADLAQAFRSYQSTWNDGRPVRVILRPKFEGDTALMGAIFPGLAPAIEEARRRPDVPVAFTDQDNAELAEQIAGSLVGSTLTQITLEKRNLRTVPIDGHVPSMEAFERGTYPYAKPLYFVVNADTNVAVTQFIAFLQSPAGKAILRTANVL